MILPRIARELGSSLLYALSETQDLEVPSAELRKVQCSRSELDVAHDFVKALEVAYTGNSRGSLQCLDIDANVRSCLTHPSSSA